MADAPLVELLVAFGNELRDEGLPVGSGEVLTCAEALAELEPSDLLDLYWAGRTTIVSRRDHIPIYDRVFRRFFLDEREDVREPLRETISAATASESVLQVPAAEPGPPGHDEDEEAELGYMAADVEVWRTKSFAACTPDELAAVRRIMARIRLTPPRRCTRRTAPAGDGPRPDLRRQHSQAILCTRHRLQPGMAGDL